VSDAGFTMSMVKPASVAVEIPRTVSADERTLVEVQKVIGRLRRLWEGRGAMFEALAQEQEPEGGGADGVPLHHQKFWESLHQSTVLLYWHNMLTFLEGVDFIRYRCITGGCSGDAMICRWWMMPKFSTVSILCLTEEM
jgi:hypothetical protein